MCSSSLSLKFLEDVVRIIRSSMKEILNLPSDIPSTMLYSPRTHRGLGLIRATWEASLQHFNITKKLENANDPFIAATRLLKDEQKLCLHNLHLDENLILPLIVKL